MWAEIGHFALCLALVASVVLGVMGLWSAATQREIWMRVCVGLTWAHGFVLLLAFACLAVAFLTNDFSVKYVANHSNTLLPDMYKFAAIWGGHEGSLLLWALVLGGWMVAVSVFRGRLPLSTLIRVLGVMGLISTGFLSFMLFTSNPFDRLLPSFPLDGGDLNPLLQDPGLIIHPPMLYMGYVGFSVAFGFAMAGLLEGRLDSAWARWSRPWTTVAWCFLTIGIALGSWWAYYELGWGGWWFWDPVENASLMPWLVGTALIHSLAVTEKRGAFKAWTIFLAISAFSLSLLGTFLVRSGVLTSVHAFASDPDRGLYILMFLLLVVGSALVLFAVRAIQLRSHSQFTWLSREVMLLINNALMTIATATVLAGTLFPVIAEVFGLGKLSVGPPFFNALIVPMAWIMMVFLGLAPWINWRNGSLVPVKWPVVSVLVGSLVLGIGLPLLFAHVDWRVSLALLLAFWVIGLTALDGVRKVRHRDNKWSAYFKLPLSYHGMVMAHVGVAILVIGIANVTAYDVEKDVRLAPGQHIDIGDYRFEFQQLIHEEGPNYIADRGVFQVFFKDQPVVQLTPEKRFYPVARNSMTEASIDGGLFRDLYIALGEPLSDQDWAVRVYVKPFVSWLWTGALLMALGGLLAILDKRYRGTSKNRAAIGEANHG